MEEWKKKKEEEEAKNEERRKKEEEKRKQRQKSQEEYFSKQKNKISEYREELHQKNTELLQFLSTTKSEKKLGALKYLKNPGVIEKIDFGNEYHLPQIVRTVEMMENEKKICDRFLMKHKSNQHFIHPRSRRMTRQSPMTHRSRNTFEDSSQYNKTQPRLLSPQSHQIVTQHVYTKRDLGMAKSFIKSVKRKAKVEQVRKSPLQKYISKRAQDVNKPGDVEQPKYKKEKVAESFQDFNNSKKEEKKDDEVKKSQI